MTGMPTIDLSKLAGDAELYARQITKRDGRLYASRPMRASGRAQYVWRHVVFYVSPNPKHQCMPVLDFCYLGDEDWDDRSVRREVERRLHDIAQEIVDAVPVEQWHGVRRWGQVFGMIGTPRYNREGAVIYR